MDQLAPASFVPRPRRRVILLIPALLAAMLLTAGCSSRRKSMRPVYMTPAPSSVSCPSPGAASVPSSEPALLSPSASATPSIPLIDNATTPAGGSPPRPPAPNDEPPLDLKPADPASSSRTSPNSSPSSSGSPNGYSKGSNTTSPTLQGPKSSTSLQDGQRTPSGRVRQASLRARLEPLVNDPADLFTPPKADKPWKYIVLHHSASSEGNLDDIDHQHRETHQWDGCGYHFVIGNGTGSPDGKIEVAARWADQKQGIHCRNGKNSEMSEYGIGICLVGDLDKAPPTPKQIASAQALVAYLSTRYQIPATRVASHEHLAATPTTCPGKLFPSQAILGANYVTRH